VAPRKKRDAENRAPVDPLQKIAGLLAIQVARDMEKDEAAKLLEGIGFTDPEINGVLGTSESYLRVMRHNARKAKKRHR
jgi:hypothetical protein